MEWLIELWAAEYRINRAAITDKITAVGDVFTTNIGAMRDAVIER